MAYIGAKRLGAKLRARGGVRNVGALLGSIKRAKYGSKKPNKRGTYKGVRPLNARTRRANFRRLRKG